MERPNIELYEKNLRGYNGMALARNMEHVKVESLLQYIKYLESNMCKCKKEE